MADAAQTVNAGQTLQSQLLLTTKVTFDEDVVAGDSLNNLGQLSVGECACAKVRRNAGLLKHLLGGGGTNAVDVAQGGLNALLIGYFDTEKTSPNGVLVMFLLLSTATLRHLCVQRTIRLLLKFASINS